MTTVVASVALAVGAAAAGPPVGALPLAGDADVPVPLNECARQENGDPVVTGLEVQPAAIDVTDGPAAVTVSVAAADTGGPGPASGLAEVLVGLAPGEPGKPGVPVLPVGYRSDDQGAAATVGADGRYHATVTVPQGAPAGNWHAVVQVLDRLGHRHAFYEVPETDLGPSRLAVTSDRGAAQAVLTGLTLSRSGVDTRRDPRTVTVTAKVRRGLPGTAGLRVTAYGTRLARVSSVSLARLSVSDGVETWRGGLRIPRWAGTQRYGLYLGLVDELGRSRLYYRSTLAAAGLPSQVTVRSKTDRERPSVTFLRIRPRTLDVAEHDGRIAVRVRVRDVDSGVRSVTARLGREDSGPPGEYGLRRVSGGPHDGVWRGTIPVDRCYSFDEAGSVRVTATDSSDRMKPLHSYRVGLPVRVRWPDVRAELVGASPDALSLDFREPVVGITPESAVLVVDLPQRVVTGTWSCHDAAGSLVDCVRGPVLRAELHVADPTSLPTPRTVRLNPEHRLDVRDLAGNPYYRFDVSGSWG